MTTASDFVEEMGRRRVELIQLYKQQRCGTAERQEAQELATRLRRPDNSTNQQPREATICNGAVKTISGHLRECRECGARGTGLMPRHARREPPREETLLSIRLANAKRNAIEALDQIGSARHAARDGEQIMLANELANIWVQQQRIVNWLVRIVDTESPLEAE